MYIDTTDYVSNVNYQQTSTAVNITGSAEIKGSSGALITGSAEFTRATTAEISSYLATVGSVTGINALSASLATSSSLGKVYKVVSTRHYELFSSSVVARNGKVAKAGSSVDHSLAAFDFDKSRISGSVTVGGGGSSKFKLTFDSSNNNYLTASFTAPNTFGLVFAKSYFTCLGNADSYCFGFRADQRTLSRTPWPPRLLWVSPIYTLEHVRHLRRGDRHRAGGRRRPDELPAIQSLGVKRKPDPVVPQDLRHIAATASEDVEIASMGIALETLLNLQRQTLHAATHVSMPRRNPDPDAGRDWDHDRDNAFRTRVSAAVSTSAHTMIRSPPASTISIWPVEPELECSTAVSGSIVTGKIAVTSVAAEGSKPNCRRQVKSWFALRS
jgi:hypothetical protein